MMKKKNAKSFRRQITNAMRAGEWQRLKKSGKLTLETYCHVKNATLNFEKAITASEREKQVLLEIFARNVGRVFSGDEFEQRYGKACYEKLFDLEKKRKAFEFVRQFYNAATLCAGGTEAITAEPELLKLVAAPLLDALEKRDAEFFKALAEAIGILKQREKSNKTKYPGSRAKWLLEYGLGNRFEHTARELNEQFVSKIWSISDDKLRRECKGLGVDLKPGKRGPKANSAPDPQKKVVN